MKKLLTRYLMDHLPAGALDAFAPGSSGPEAARPNQRGAAGGR